MEDERGLYIMGKPVLFGNALSVTLVRRRVLMEPVTLALVARELATRPFQSFWGHPDSLAVVNVKLSAEGFGPIDITPKTPDYPKQRPAVSLTPDGLPMLNGTVFDECLLLSPDIGKRPEADRPLRLEDIKAWNPVRASWLKEHSEGEGRQI